MKRSEQNILTVSEWRKFIKNTPPKTCAEAPGFRKFEFDTGRKAVGVNPDTGMKIYKFRASSADVDRDGDTIAQDGILLDNYKKNPVVLYGHDQFGRFPVGKALAAYVESGSLYIEVDFTPREVSEKGHEVYRLVDGSFLNAVSVGFGPKKFLYNSETGGYDFDEIELYEVSIVSVPANADAVIAAGISPAGVKLLSTGESAEDALDAATHKATGSPSEEDPSNTVQPNSINEENAMDPKEFKSAMESVMTPIAQLLSELPSKVAEAVAEKAKADADPEVSSEDIAKALTEVFSANLTAEDGALRDEE